MYTQFAEPDELGMISPCWRRRPLRMLAERAFLWTLCSNKKRRSEDRLFRRTTCPMLLNDDLDPAVLRLAHAVGGRDQKALLAHANDRDGLRRHAFAHQGILDRVGATQ